jgi:hypothetical protein
MHVTIIGRPAGEAAEGVRDAWIGLRLPLANPRMRNWHGLGVLSGPSGFLRQLWALIRGPTFRTQGYLINAKAAVEILAQANPTAAAWWRENASQLLTGRSRFVFEERLCQPGGADADVVSLEISPPSSSRT